MRKIKKIIIYSLIIVFSLTLTLSAQTEDFSPEFFRKLADSVNEKPEINVPDYQVLELDNQMKFYLAQDKSLPIFEIRGYIDGGKIDENKNNAGITSLMTETMLLATENYNENELSRFKEINALSLNLGSSLDRISISGDSLKSERTELISLLAEVLRKPKFEGKHFERTVKENQQLYQQQFHDDSALLNMYFFKNLYGEHPYGYNHNYNLILDFLRNVEAEEVEEFYQKTVNPKDTVIIISGDFNYADLKTELKNKFGSWKNKNYKIQRDYVKVDPKIHNKVLLIDKQDATQANMRMGYNFYKSNYHKRIPFMMGNRIFGSGGFNSRLMEKLRSDKGYVYGTNAQTRYHDYGGAYYINLSLDPNKALAGMRAVEQEMKKIKSGKEALKKDELFENVNLYNAIFPKAYKNQINVLDRIVYQLEFYNKSDDYLNNYIDQYNALNIETVQQIFSEELYPQILFTVIVGPKDQILPQFKEAGIEVEVINN